MSLESDLPLLANFDEVKVKHYSLDLLCDFDKKAFTGSLILDIDTSTSKAFSKIILDCCDIIVTRVSNMNRTKQNKIIEIQDEVYVNLTFEQSEWCLTIDCDNATADLVKIEYKTEPSTRSLHWRTDCDGNPCVYTPAAAVNNRGLFPCQDLPGAMSTWDLTVRLPISSSHAVFCTGDKHPKVDKSDLYRRFFFETSIVLPLSTFAIAVGTWQTTDLSIDLSGTLLPIRLIGPRSLLTKQNFILPEYLVEAVRGAVDILGPYPLPKLDVLVIPRSFSGLGLASPNLTFISTSLLLGDYGNLVKVSHEICHAWFGIMIGAKDWTEAWLSEGFATFLEDFVHQKTLNALGLAKNEQLMHLRAKIKLRSLKTETENVSSELLELRPMKGKKLYDANDTQFVKNGLNPMAGLSQSHYLKGYFLLHYLMDSVGKTPFLKLIRTYFDTYKGQLVDSTQFLQLYYEHFSSSATQAMEQIICDWLDSPGLPKALPHLNILQSENLGLFRDILDMNHEICDLNLRNRKNRKENIEIYSNDLRYSEQINLLLNMLLEQKLHGKLLDHLYQSYQPFIESNPDLQHLWCELIIRNKLKRSYNHLKRFLLEHQCMGVYLYFEMMHSKNAILMKLGREIFYLVQNELDSSLKAVLQELFPQ